MSSDPPFPILAHGSGWLVTEKPAGTSIHNEPGLDLRSRLYLYLQSDDCISIDPGFGLNAVNRLDRETSGLVLMAGRRKVYQSLSRKFVQGEVDKIYLALVHGAVPAGAGELWEQWDWPLTKTASGRRDIQGRGKRVGCITRYQVLGHSRHYSLVRCRLITGRKHQIRRHAALAGHPVLGDQRYGSARACRYLARHHHFTRLALHAARLTIQTPGEPIPQTFVSPQLPEEIQQLLNSDGLQQF
jgi:23S rRNA-/tRNA-specific pseudouridylate synthase